MPNSRGCYWRLLYIRKHNEMVTCLFWGVSVCKVFRQSWPAIDLLARTDKTIAQTNPLALRTRKLTLKLCGAVSGGLQTFNFIKRLCFGRLAGGWLNVPMTGSGSDSKPFFALVFLGRYARFWHIPDHHINADSCSFIYKKL